jgi:hypothetical protein
MNQPFNSQINNPTEIKVCQFRGPRRAIERTTLEMIRSAQGRNSFPPDLLKTKPVQPPSPWISCRRLFIVCLLCLPLLVPLKRLMAQPDAKSELSKADALAYFVLNCAYFGKWPANSDPQISKTLLLGVLGGDPFGDSLSKVSSTAQSAWFREGRILIKRSDRPEDLSQCHVVFIGLNVKGDLGRVLIAFKGKPVLLVSEILNFAQQGGTVEVRIEAERLRFVLNLDHLQQSKVELSSRMKQRAVAFIRHGEREPNPYLEGGGQ